MKKPIKVVLIILAGLLALVIYASLTILTGAVKVGHATNALVTEAMSPDGSRKAIVFTRTTVFKKTGKTISRTHLSVIPHSVPLPLTDGNVLVASANTLDPKQDRSVAPSVEAQWTKDGALLVQFGDNIGVQVFKDRKDYPEDLVIRYEVLTKDGTQPWIPLDSVKAARRPERSE